MQIRDVARSHKVCDRLVMLIGAREAEPGRFVLVVLLNLEFFHGTKHEHVDRDLRRVVNQFQALFDGAVRVDVLNHVVVAEHVILTVSIPMVGREQAWDASGREGGFVELVVAGVVLVKE